MGIFKILATVPIIATLVSAAQCEPMFGFGAGNGCLCKDTAHELVKNFISLTNGNGFNTTLANALLTENIVDTSGSVASIIDMGNTAPVPLLGPTLVNRTSFIAANSAQASTPYKPLNIYWTCNVVTFRFEIPFKPQPVLGISILETVAAPEGSEFPFLIDQVYGELNSFAFLVDLGIYTPIAPSNTSSAEKVRRHFGDRR